MNIVIAVAHQLELEPFKARFDVEYSYTPGHGKVYLLESAHSAVHLLQTGIGMESARKSIDLTLENISEQGVRPDLLMNFGTCGAIHPERRVGDVVIGTKSVCEQMETIALDSVWSGYYGEYLRSTDRNYYEGIIYSTDKAVADRDERHRIYRETGAQVVDMECYSLADAATHQKLPLISVKYVSDNADEFVMKDFMANVEDATSEMSELMHGFIEYLQEHKHRFLS